MDSHPESVRYARRWAREFVTSLGPGMPEGTADDVVLIVSELVTNAVRYGTEPGDALRATLTAEPRRVRIEVQDPCRRHPRTRPTSDERGRGRGLHLVEALAARWGTDDVPFGKVVWVEVTW
ncbi:ATP-binding protein [Streptomyces zhihengii]